MVLKNLQFFIIIILLLQGCHKKEDKNPVTLPEGSINISDLKTKHDYHLPFAIVNNNTNIQLALLNNETVDFVNGGFIEFKENGFYQLVLEHRNLQQTNDTFLFTTKTEEREDSEWGIMAWIPAPFKTSSLVSEDIEMYYPHRYIDAIKVPFIFYIKDESTVKSVYCEGRSLSSGESFNIKQGVGSLMIPASSVSDYQEFIVGGKHSGVSITKMQEAPIELTGIINTQVDIPANSFLKIRGDLNISSKGTLTIHEGTVILIDEAANINVEGPIVFSGTSINPVFVTCSQKDKYWGGFITRVAGGTIDAHYTIYCQSGYHDSEAYNWGHSGRQALFYTENSTLKLDHCFILDNIGQIFYPQNASIFLDNVLVQRAQTGGQINNSYISIHNSIFTDFPDDTDVFVDKDNDALYLSASDADIDNSKFMFAKDDGLDSGNTEGGQINVTNCRFEACFHEGAALSSGNQAVKKHTFKDCVFINCGQGLELGFSSPNHSVIAENCQFLNNGIGIRYGDNYDWSEVDGEMLIKNSFSLNNGKDVWNMVRMTWKPKIERLSFDNTIVSKLCPQYPQLEIKNN